LVAVEVAVQEITVRQVQRGHRVEAVDRDSNSPLLKSFRIPQISIMFAVRREQVELRMLVEMAAQQLFKPALVIF
jgi:hypothetical protein